MWTIRKASERGHANHGWLDTHHTFSFANFYDPKHMGFGPLRVINDDRVAGGAGFPTHPHRDMEIVTMVVEGALEHQDTTGAGGIIRPGDFQHMTAGDGVRHSEFNASATEPVRFLQIWIQPEAPSKEPTYNQRHLSLEQREGQFALVASRKGEDGAFVIGQDVNLYACVLHEGQQADVNIGAGRGAWIQVVRGSVALGDDVILHEGDGAYAIDPKAVCVHGRSDHAEVILFDVAG